jgi:hypothetical protein
VILPREKRPHCRLPSTKRQFEHLFLRFLKKIGAERPETGKEAKQKPEPEKKRGRPAEDGRASGSEKRL